MRYNLSSSQSDRISFDDAIRRYAWELANQTDAQWVNDPYPYFEQFMADVDTDDQHEAEARFIDLFCDTYNSQLIALVVDELEEVDEPVTVYEEGNEVVGTFRNGQDAADMLRRSDVKQWANKPVWEGVTE